jgi:hypothetical protein
VTVDNPTERHFGSGYFIRLNGGTGGANGNICYGGTACAQGLPTPAPKLNVRIYEYFSNGQWGIADDAGFAPIPLFDNETADGGLRLEITLTDAFDNYELVMTPLANPAMTYTHLGAFDNPGVPIDWLEFTFFNTDGDTGTPPVTATDFYIRSLEIADNAAAGKPGDFDLDGDVDGADLLVWQRGGSPNPGSSADLALWRTHFGGGASPGRVAAVPEPGAWTLAVIGLAGALRRRLE